MANIKHEIDTPSARFEITVIAPGEIEIYTPDGSIEIRPRHDNGLRIRCVPNWDDETAIRIVEHMLSCGGTYHRVAEKIIQTLRGRTNVNKH